MYYIRQQSGKLREISLYYIHCQKETCLDKNQKNWFSAKGIDKITNQPNYSDIS